MKKLPFLLFFIIAILFQFPTLAFAQSNGLQPPERNTLQPLEENGSSGNAADSAPSDLPVAAGKMMIAPDYYPRPGGGPLPFAGQNHAYSVVLRGNGEAIITMKVALTNSNEDDERLTSTALRLPSRIIPKDLAVYQIITQGYCIRYEDRPVILDKQNYNPNWQPRCSEYSEPDYYNYYGGGKYLKAKFAYNGDTLNINLPQPVGANKSGAFFVYFRTMSYAKKNFSGAYTFNFESLKTNDSINQLNIGISTDSDLYLKGSKGSVDYRYTDSAVALKSAGGEAAPAASPVIDRLVSQIGQGTIVKTASNLAPLESYKVSGMYANSRLKLYGREITITIISILILALIVFTVIRKVLRMLSPKATDAKKQAVENSLKQEKAKLFMSAFGISFLSSVLMAWFTVILLIVMQNLNYIDYQMASLLRVAGIIFSFCIYAVMLFIPGIYFGYKKGMGWGILTVVLTVFWLFIYFAIGLLIVFFFGFQPNYPVYGGGGIVPMMQGVAK